jgi:hypothetical protein
MKINTPQSWQPIYGPLPSNEPFHANSWSFVTMWHFSVGLKVTERHETVRYSVTVSQTGTLISVRKRYHMIAVLFPHPSEYVTVSRRGVNRAGLGTEPLKFPSSHSTPTTKATGLRSGRNLTRCVLYESAHPSQPFASSWLSLARPKVMSHFGPTYKNSSCQPTVAWKGLTTCLHMQPSILYPLRLSQNWCNSLMLRNT